VPTARRVRTLNLTLPAAVPRPNRWRTSAAGLVSQGRRNRTAFCIFRADVQQLTRKQAFPPGFNPLSLTRSACRTGLGLAPLRLTAGRTTFSKPRIDTSAETY